MVDEADTSRETKCLYEQLAKTAIANFQRVNINAQYTSDRKEALSVILGLVPEGATVGFGDSVTLHQVGVLPELKRRNRNVIFDPVDRDEEGYFRVIGEARQELRRKALVADVFLTGTNAITLDGKLVNVDGAGNRVAAMIFGPRKVIVAVGANKIVRNLDDAMRRIREIAAPMNAQRHYLKHHLDRLGELACVKAGRCVDCKSPYRICRYTVIIEGEPRAALGPEGQSTVYKEPRLNVVIIGENLGF